MEQKRRGRPPKGRLDEAAAFAGEVATSLGEIMTLTSEAYGQPFITETDSGHADRMNAVALRIWESQSPDLNNRERVARVKSRLVKMGFTDLGALSLPCDEKHLNA